VAFFSPEPILASARVHLVESRIGLMARVASAADVPVVVTHLAASRRNRPHREEQIRALLPWADSHGPGVLVGDLNARPGDAELGSLLARYHDAWAEAAGRGAARGVETGSTRPGGDSRIDYVLYARGAPLYQESVDVVDTSPMPGAAEVSDHRPVVATFRRARNGRRPTPETRPLPPGTHVAVAR
jgi:endonuclease/exonuclease/phosphatase family metal-dependent hydrolase